MIADKDGGEGSVNYPERLMPIFVEQMRLG